jgi:hypothetical protein
MYLGRQKQEEEAMNADFSGLKRPRHAMPDFVKNALNERGLMVAYKGRPAYQQNDYIGWINNVAKAGGEKNGLK